MTPLERAIEIRDSGKISVTPSEACKLIGGSAYGISLAAKKGMLGIPYFMSGRNTRISINGIINYLQGGITSLTK